ncbi:hypothetical protein [Saccharothrix variisporea]|nr:hypothetical protein [Saccharothrix variisporea]
MRLSKAQAVEGLPAVQARELMKAFRTSPKPVMVAAEVLDVDDAIAEEVLSRFVEAGYLEITDRDADGDNWWFTTVRGNALAAASFSKPITRATATRNLEGLLDRVRAYNADRTKPYSITHVTVFGSYLDESQDRLGDLDVAIEVVRRLPHDEFTQRRDALTAAADRYFGSYVERLLYPLRQLVLYLRDRKSTISITSEDISQLTDRMSVVYDIKTDKEAEQPHEGATVEPLA